MKFLKDKQTRHDFVTYAMCIVAFAIVFFMQSNHMIPRMIAGQLVPITAYIVMAFPSTSSSASRATCRWAMRAL